MHMKKWLISAVTLTLALSAAGAVTAFAMTGGGGSDSAGGADTAGEVTHGDPTYEEWISDFGDGKVLTSADDIDPNVCNTVHNINACSQEELEELGMLGPATMRGPFPFVPPTTGSDVVGESRDLAAISWIVGPGTEWPDVLPAK